jgi:hypothetical protein
MFAYPVKTYGDGGKDQDLFDCDYSIIRACNSR